MVAISCATWDNTQLHWLLSARIWWRSHLTMHQITIGITVGVKNRIRSERMSRVLCSAGHTISHFRDESYTAVLHWYWQPNLKQTIQNTQKPNHKTNELAIDKKNAKTHRRTQNSELYLNLQVVATYKNCSYVLMTLYNWNTIQQIGIWMKNDLWLHLIKASDGRMIVKCDPTGGCQFAKFIRFCVGSDSIINCATKRYRIYENVLT